MRASAVAGSVLLPFSLKALMLKQGSPGHSESFPSENERTIWEGLGGVFPSFWMISLVLPYLFREPFLPHCSSMFSFLCSPLQALQGEDPSDGSPLSDKNPPNIFLEGRERYPKSQDVKTQVMACLGSIPRIWVFSAFGVLECFLNWSSLQGYQERCAL